MSTMEIPGLQLQLYALFRLAVSAYICCRRFRWFREPDGISIQQYGSIHVARHREGDRIRYVTPPREIDPFEGHAKVPWLWIGVSEERGDYTEEIANYMVPGNVISPELIHAIFPDTADDEIKYLCSDSLETKVLPSEGIVIQDASASTGAGVSDRG